MPPTLSVRQVLRAVGVPTDGCLAAQEPDEFVCCFGYSEALRAVPDYCLAIRNQGFSRNLEVPNTHHKNNPCVYSLIKVA